MRGREGKRDGREERKREEKSRIDEKETSRGKKKT